MPKADLARERKKSRAWVTQLLSGKSSLTIQTLAEVTRTLGGKVEITCSSPMGTRAARSR